MITGKHQKTITVFSNRVEDRYLSFQQVQLETILWKKENVYVSLDRNISPSIYNVAATVIITITTT